MESYHYPYAAVERAMKIQEVILRAMDEGLISGEVHEDAPAP